MDPNATYDAMVDAVVNQEWEEATEAAHNLWNWICGGGFLPSRPDLGALTPTIPGPEIAPGLRHLVAGINKKLHC